MNAGREGDEEMISVDALLPFPYPVLYDLVMFIIIVYILYLLKLKQAVFILIENIYFMALLLNAPDEATVTATASVTASATATAFSIGLTWIGLD